MRTHNQPISVDGSIIKELSEKIPTNTVAINELIKNSYDADATYINIRYSKKLMTLILSDDGHGMGEDEFKELLHISSSNKQYGTIHNDRYVQGSKGLGFLSVFKFGKTVEWKSVCNGIQSRLRINKQELISQKDLSSFVVEIEETATDKSNGTSIEIQIDENSIDLIDEDLKNPQNSSKIVHSFLPQSESNHNDKSDSKNTKTPFNVILDIEGQGIITSDSLKPLSSVVPDKQEFEVTYSSNNKKEIFRRGESEYTISGPDCDIRGSFRCEAHLMLYKLSPGEVKRRFPSLFQIPTGNGGLKLSPMLYINDNLFNNFTIFDPEVTRHTKSNHSMPQMIGYICIYCNDPDFQFNSDRTQFAQSSLTRQITSFLEKLNIDIQKNASDRFHFLPIREKILNNPNTIAISKDLDDNRKLDEAWANIKPDFNFQNDLDIQINGDEITYTFLGDSADVHFAYPEDEESQATDIPQTDVGHQRSPKNSPKDSIRSNASRYNKKKKLIHKIDDEQTEPSFNCLGSSIQELVKEINSIDFTSYTYLVAASARVLFDAPTARIINCDAHDADLDYLKDLLKPVKDLPSQVKIVIQYFLDATINGKQTKIFTSLHRSVCPGVGYRSFFDSLATAPQKYSDAARQSNAGSHEGVNLLTTSDVEDILMKASMYAQLIEAYLETNFGKEVKHADA